MLRRRLLASCAGAPRRRRPAIALAAAAAAQRAYCVGCGSNVIDLFFPVRQFPEVGTKAYFSEETICSGRVVGGVTLNHLVWARTLGTPAGLMALQGDEENGQEIRQKLSEMGVDTSTIRVSERYSTSVSHILSSPGGERTIIMAPASTSQLTSGKMEAEFGSVIRTRADMVTTEISQVPLSGVLYLLEAARQKRIPSCLDIDVTPEVALGPARLGTKTELLACVTSASLVKLTAAAAAEVLALVAPEAALDSTLEGAAKQLAEALKARVCVVTDGANGLALALGGGSAVAPVRVAAMKGVHQVDATGAGDAAFGGLVASLHAKGFPADEAALERMGKVAAAAGAACVEVQGALPLPGKSARRVLELAPEARKLVDLAKALDVGIEHAPTAAGGGGGLSASQAEAALSPAVQAYASSLQEDAKALKALSKGLLLQEKDGKLKKAVALLAGAHSDTNSKTHVYTSGIGKSGLVAARLASTLRSISIRSSHVPGNEWVHGDLGTIAEGDVLICMSHSGKTTELVDATRRVRARGGNVIAITGNPRSPLAMLADIHLHANVTSELLGKIPSRSIVANEAIVNGLITAVAEATGLTTTKFQDNHPGGAIGASSGRS